MISSEQMDVLDRQMRGHLNGINDVAFRAAVEATAEEYIRDIGGIPFTRQTACANGEPLVLVAPNDGTVLVVDRVIADGAELPRDAWRTETVAGRVYVSFQTTATMSNLVVCARWIPSVETTELPDDFFRDNAKAIKDGALAFLLSQAGRPWGDAATAAHFLVEYDKDRYDARSRRMNAAENANTLVCFDRTDTWL